MIWFGDVHQSLTLLLVNHIRHNGFFQPLKLNLSGHAHGILADDRSVYAKTRKQYLTALCHFGADRAYRAPDFCFGAIRHTAIRVDISGKKSRPSLRVAAPDTIGYGLRLRATFRSNS